MAYQNIISLSNGKASFLTSVASDGTEIFAIRDAYEMLGKERSTRELLDRLVDKCSLERIEKGKYLIAPLEAGPDRTWSEDTYVIAAHLVEPSAIAYWSTLNYWNLTEQVPVSTTSRPAPARRTAGPRSSGCDSGSSA